MQLAAVPVSSTILSSNRVDDDEFKVPENRTVKSKNCHHRLLNRFGASDDLIKSGMGKIAIGLALEIIGPIVGDFVGWQLNKIPFILNNVTKVSDAMLIGGIATAVYTLSCNQPNKQKTMLTTTAIASMIGIIGLGEFFDFPVSAFLRDRILPSVGIVVGGILFKEMFGYSVGSLDGKEGYLQSTGRFIGFQFAFDIFIPTHSDPVINFLAFIPRLTARCLTGVIGYHWYKAHRVFKRYMAQERSDRHFFEMLIDFVTECIKDRANREGISQCLSENLPKFLTFFETRNNLFIEQIRSTIKSTIKTAADQTKVTFILLEKYLSDIRNDSEILSLHDAFKTQFMSCVNKVDSEEQIELERLKNELIESIKNKLGIANKQATTKPDDLLGSVTNYFVRTVTENPDNRVSQFYEATITSITDEFAKCLDEIDSHIPKFVTKKIAEELCGADQKAYIKELFEIHLKHFLLFTLEKQQAFQNEPLSHTISNKLIKHIHQLLFALPNSPNRFSRILNVIERITLTGLNTILKIYSGENNTLRHSGAQKDRYIELPALHENYSTIELPSPSKEKPPEAESSPASSPDNIRNDWESILPPVIRQTASNSTKDITDIADDYDPCEDPTPTNLERA